MPAKYKAPAIVPAEWPPERSLRAVRAQFDALGHLKGLNCPDGEPQEKAWEQVTEAVLRRAFDSNSHIILNFRRASSAGSYNIMGVSGRQRQSNYLARLNAYETALKTATSDLQMSMPEETAGIYQAEDPFAFYNDLRDILDRASGEIFIADAYIDNSLFELYLGNLNKTIKLRVLSNNLPGNTLAVAKLFAASRQSFELRTSKSLHDRAIFVDDRCWIVGQSVKDAATKKPTYMVEFSNPIMRTIYETIWTDATSVVKS